MGPALGFLRGFGLGSGFRAYKIQGLGFRGSGFRALIQSILDLPIKAFVITNCKRLKQLDKVFLET